MNSIGRRHRWSSSEVQNHLGTLSSLPPCGRTGAASPRRCSTKFGTPASPFIDLSRTSSTSGTTRRFVSPLTSDRCSHLIPHTVRKKK